MASESGKLIVRLEDQTLRTEMLEPGVLRIGRMPDNGLVLDDSRVSRHHAEVRVGEGGPLLTDLGSSNGTFVGETRLLPQQPFLLQNGMVFRIGPFSVTYEAPAEEHPTLALQSAVPETPVPDAPDPAPAADAPSGLEPLSPDGALVSGNGAGKPVHAHQPPAYVGQSAYLSYLPAIFQENEFLGRFLLIFETLWEPLERRQDHIELYFDPQICPPSFLPWLASWLHVSFDRRWPEERRRRLLSEAVDLYRWRGTRYGLLRIIEVCTGITPEIREEPSQPFVFQVTIPVPTGDDVPHDLVEDLVRAHKPAHAGYVLHFT